MALIALLDVLLRAKTDGFTKPMTDAERQTKKSEAAIVASVGRISAGVNRAWSIIKWAIFASIVKKSLDSIINTVKEMSDVGRKAASIGIAPDVFMSLGTLAKKVGVETEILDTAIVKLAGHLANPPGEFAIGLKRIGLNIEQIQKKDLGQAFLDISEAIKKLPSPAIQAAAAMEIFGKAGPNILRVLQQGRPAIEGWIDAQKALGVAMTPDEMGEFERARQALPKFEAVWNGAWNRMILAMTPLIENIGGFLAENLQNIIPLVRTFTGAFIGGLWATSVGVAYLIDGFKAVGAAIVWVVGSAISFFSILAEEIEATFEMLSRLPKSMGGGFFNDSRKYFRDWKNDLDTAAGNMKDWSKDVIGNFGSSAEAVTEWFERIFSNRKMPALKPEVILPKAFPDAGTLHQGLAFANKGSEEAFKAVSEYQKDKATDQLLLLAEQVRQSQAAAALLGQIAGAIAGGVPIIPAHF